MLAPKSSMLFRKENFSPKQPFLLPPQHWMISLHFLRKKNFAPTQNGNLSFISAL
jgi:hypothetical protein